MDDFAENERTEYGAGDTASEKARLLSDLPSVEDLPRKAEEAAPVERTPYVHKRAPRRTIEAIDDLADDESSTVYTHESDIAIGGMVSDGRYRRARAEVSQFQKNNRYGQYLEVPKGRRSIFVKRESARRRRSVLAALVVIALLAVVAYVVWQLMSKLSLGNLILGDDAAGFIALTGEAKATASLVSALLC